MTQSVNEKLDWFIWAKTCVSIVRSIICSQSARLLMWSGGWDVTNTPFYIAVPFVLLMLASIVFALKGLVWLLYDWFWRDYAIEEFAKFVCLQRPKDNETD